MVGGRGVFLWRVELCDLELSWGSIDPVVEITSVIMGVFIFIFTWSTTC